MINLLPFMELHHLNIMRRSRRCPSKYSGNFYAGVPKIELLREICTLDQLTQCGYDEYSFNFADTFSRLLFSLHYFFFGMMPFDEYGLNQCDRIASNHLLCIMLKKLHKHIRRSHRFYYKHRVQVCCCFFFFREHYAKRDTQPM